MGGGSYRLPVVWPKCAEIRGRTGVWPFLLRILSNRQGSVRLDAPPACDPSSRISSAWSFSGP